MIVINLIITVSAIFNVFNSVKAARQSVFVYFVVITEFADSLFCIVYVDFLSACADETDWAIADSNNHVLLARLHGVIARDFYRVGRIVTNNRIITVARFVLNDWFSDSYKENGIVTGAASYRIFAFEKSDIVIIRAAQNSIPLPVDNNRIATCSAVYRTLRAFEENFIIASLARYSAF